MCSAFGHKEQMKKQMLKRHCSGRFRTITSMRCAPQGTRRPERAKKSGHAPQLEVCDYALRMLTFNS